jgi:hypothetical protein
MTAIEMTGAIDEQRQLRLDGQLPVVGPARVKVIILYPSGGGIDEVEWLRSAAHNAAAFSYLKEPAEDIYTLSDGKPFHDKSYVDQ